jgi:hypothetical protein
MRDRGGKVGLASEPKSAVVRDDTPPARYPIGEWQTLPYSTLENKLALKAMSVTGQNGCPKIEDGAVQYYFHCVSGGGPDSGWIDTPNWLSPSLADGVYKYQFKMRDTSPQKNETPYSSIEAVTVSIKTGYHSVEFAGLAALSEGALVKFIGKVESVLDDAYVVKAGGATIKVMTQAAGSATKPEMKGKDVTVKGCVWIVSGEKCVTWAEVN